MTPPTGDQANAVVSGQFTTAIGAAKSASFQCWGGFNLCIYGSGGPNGSWSGSVQLERSFDGGTTWIVCGIGGAGAQAVWTTGTDVSIVVGEPEKGVLYRLNCTAISEGPINYRFSTTGMAAVSLAIGTPIG